MYRLVLVIANVVTTVALVASLGFIAWEKTWVKAVDRSPVEEFLYGSTGTELAPLLVFQILPILFPEHLQPMGPGAGDWIDQFGFQRGKPDVNDGLPYGVFSSNHRPQSGDPSPIRFVGFNCAICHTGRILPIEGAGKPSAPILGESLMISRAPR